MRLLFFCICMLVLVACNTPGPHFRGLTAVRVTVEGSTFDVRVRDRLAEALRVNPEYAPRFGPIKARAAIAMAQVSGCKVTEVRGDQAMATGLLDCGKGPPKTGLARGAEYTCYPISGVGKTGIDARHVTYNCDPV